MDRSETSLTELIAREREPLVASALRITRRRDLAEDATQDALAHAWRDRERVLHAREPRAVLGWLTRLHAGMQRRGEARHGGVRDLDRLAEVALPEANADRELVERAWSEVARLPRTLRQAVELRFREGMTFAAIAVRCGIAEGTAHERVERGLESLRKRLPRDARRDSRAAWCSMSLWLRRSLAPLRPFHWTRFAAAGIAASILTVSTRDHAHADVLARSVEATVPTIPTSVPPAHFDLAEFRKRVDLDDYLDAGGQLPPRSKEDEQAIPTCALRGRVFDARGRVLDDARIEIRRKVEGVDLEIVVARTATEFDGSFEITDVKVEGRLRMVVLRRTLVALERDLEVASHASLDLGTIITDARIEDRRGEFGVDFVLRDTDGRAIADAPVALSRRIDAFLGAPAFEREDSGRTDSEGHIHLAGDWLGGKRLEVGTPNPNESTPARSLDLSIERGGTQSLELTLR